MTGRQGDKETRRRSPCHRVTESPCLVLAVILVVAAAFRFYGLAWDGGYLFHPDERKILLVASELHLPSNIPDFFSSESPLNPKFFAYGSFPIYLLKILGVFAPTPSFAVPWREDFVGLALLGRALSALFDLGTIALTFLLARRLYDAKTGLIASACIAVTVLHIQLSHFYAVDTLLTLLIVATMFFAARFAQEGKRRDAIAVGIAFGLALATKVSAAPLVVPIVAAVLRAQRVIASEAKQSPSNLGIASSQRTRRAMTQRAAREWLAQIWRTRRTLALILAVALAACIVTQPYALLDPIRFFGQIGTESLVARGWLDYPYTRQYSDTLPFIYPIAQSSIWGMSLPLGIFAWLGSALFVWRWWRKRDWNDGFILSWALVYFLIVGAQYAKYLRYLLPLLPFLFLMAADFTEHATRPTKHVFRVVCSVVLIVAFTYSLAFVSMYSREHPWLTISKWIYANVPPNATIAIEHWDDVLPVPMQIGEVTRAPGEYKMLTLPMYDADDAGKLDSIVNALSESDYVILATQRLSAPITRLPQRYPMSSRYYHLLFNGQLGFDLVAHAINGIALDGVVIADNRFDGMLPPTLRSDALAWNWGYADESFSVYDHPLPLVFKKTRPLSRDELKHLLQ